MIGSAQVHPLVRSAVRRQRGFAPIHVARERAAITARYAPDARAVFEQRNRERLGVAPVNIFDEGA